MDTVNYIALSIPVFFILIGIEVWYARRHDHDVYRFNDSVNDLSTGIFQQIFGVFTKTAVFASYALTWEYFRIYEFSTDHIFNWVLCFIGADFFYYWFHRTSHEVNFIWGSHVVHHQSEEYNLTVALRQSAIQNLFSAVFYIPLALAGFPPVMFLTMSSFNTLYQFWIHTQTIDRLGWYEWLFNTPSHHRVHHGCNPIYIDRNHGGTLIIWDKLFGTFQPEAEPVIYGTTKPLKSWNPLWANVQYFTELWDVSKKAQRWRDKIWIWFANPAWRPTDVPHPDPELAPLKGFKYDANGPSGINGYIFSHGVITILITVFLLFTAADANWLQNVLVAIAGTWGLVSFGALMERRRWSYLLELGRFVFVTLSSIVILQLNQWPIYYAVAGVIYGVISLIWLSRYRPELTPAPDESQVFTPFTVNVR